MIRIRITETNERFTYRGGCLHHDDDCRGNHQADSHQAWQVFACEGGQQDRVDTELALQRRQRPLKKLMIDDGVI